MSSEVLGSAESVADQARRGLATVTVIDPPNEPRRRPPQLPVAIGRYEVRGVFGSGAFATVFAADDPVLDIPVAVKLLGEPASYDPGLRRRFLDEARTLRRTRSEHLVRVHDLGEHEGRPYLVMDAYPDGSLGDELDELRRHGRRLDVARLREVIESIGRCLAAVHDAGLVHRDVKPVNLLVAPDGRLVLADFGLARSVAASGLTVGAGTVDYMAPEQRTPATLVDQRADVYAASRTVAEIVDEFVDPQVAARLAPVLSVGMREHPDERHASALEWVDALCGALDDSERGTEHERVRRAGPRRAVTAVVAVVFASLVGTVGVLLVSRRADAPTHEAASTAGPQIIGPDELLIGDRGEWTHENRPGLVYRWTLPTGERSDALVVDFTPTSPDSFDIELVESDGAQELRTTLTVSVRTR